jgi:hypothetical protein
MNTAAGTQTLVIIASFTDVAPAGPRRSPSPPLFEWAPAVAGVLDYNLRIWTLPATRPTNATVTLPAISRSYRAPTSFLSSSHIFWQIEYLLATGSLLGPLLDFYTLGLPNLAILSLAAPSSAFTDSQLGVGWTVKNVGLGATGLCTVTCEVHLSTNAVTLSSVALLARRYISLSLFPTQSLPLTVDVTTPVSLTGSFFVFTKLTSSDCADQSTVDNAQSIPISIALTPQPDLVVQIVITLSASFSGQWLTVNWQTGKSCCSWFFFCEWRMC